MPQPQDGALHPIRTWSIILFVLGLCALGWSQGAYTDKEALKYVGCAQDLLHGDLTDFGGRYLKYAAYVLFLVPFVALDAVMWAIPVQALLGVCAAFAIARLAARISTSTMAGHIAFALFLLCYPISVWVLALYTEPFFTSVAVLFLERATRDEKPGWSAVLLGLILIFARPIGILFVGPTMIWIVSRSGGEQRPGPWWLAYLTLMIGVLVLPGVEPDKLRIIVEGEVISGFSRYPGAIDRLEGSSIMAAQWQLIQERSMGECFGLFLGKLVSLFTLTRSWYSTAHNAILAVFYPLYPLAILGWLSFRRDPRIGLLSIVLLLNALLIGLTYDEWSGRFLVPLLPIVIVLATSGLVPIIHRSRGSRHSHRRT